jgi:hypothetical protein
MTMSGVTVYKIDMVRQRKDLDQLAEALAALTPKQRAQVLSKAVRKKRFRLFPKDFKPVVLSGGGVWTGGSLSRDEIYDDDGR